MIHFIESELLRVGVNPIGMELCSIRSKQSDQEYLWQGDPAFWTGQAPVLFPIIGALKHGTFNYLGKTYALPKHGFVRNSSKPRLVAASPDSLAMEMSWDEDSLMSYPFKYKLEMHFRLEGKTLHIQHHITNEGESSMLYSIGGHPAFNCPTSPEEVYEDYFLEFESEETDATWMIDPSGLISLDQKPMLDGTRKLPLHSHLFDQDALVFKQLKSRKVSLVSKISGKVLAVKFDDFDYLGIWAKPNAPFVCIEPWLGIADSIDHTQNFEEKEGLLQLEAGEKVVKTYSIEIF